MPIQELKILLVDDDPIWLLNEEKSLRKAGFKFVHKAHSVAGAKAVIQHLQPDLLVCNDTLRHDNALELLKTEIAGCYTIITSDQPRKDNLHQTTELLNSLYLVKPFHEYTLLSSIRFLMKLHLANSPAPDQCITVRDAKQSQKIFFTDILWIKAEGNYTMIHSTDRKTYALKKSLVRLLEDLDERFVRVHKAYAINADRIERIDFNRKQVMIDGEVVPIGREYRTGLESL